MNPRRLLIRFVTPLAWRLSERRMIAALQEFSLIEKDSGCQLLNAMDHICDPQVKAGLFQHVLEEFHHADLFAGTCLELARAPLETPVITRDSLIDPAAGEETVVDFVSYVHVGESAVNADFEAYSEMPVDARIRAVFRAVRADEANHEVDSRALLGSLLGGDNARLRRALRQAGRKRMWRSYVLSMRALGELPLALILGALYFLAGPFVTRVLRRRLGLSRSEQLPIALAQLRSTPADGR